MAKSLPNVDFLTFNSTTTQKKGPFENIAGKEENAGNQHFFLFSHFLLPIQGHIIISFHKHFVSCLLISSIWTSTKIMLCGKGLMTFRMKPFKIIVGEGENAGNQHFLLFPQCSLSPPRQISIFE